METKSSKSLWTSAIATMASRACNAVFAGRGHADTAHTVSRRTNTLVQRAKKWTRGRNTSLSSKAKPRKFSENIGVLPGCPVRAHLRLLALRKSTTQKVSIGIEDLQSATKRI